MQAAKTSSDNQVSELKSKLDMAKDSFERAKGEMRDEFDKELTVTKKALEETEVELKKTQTCAQVS